MERTVQTGFGLVMLSVLLACGSPTPEPALEPRLLEIVVLGKAGDCNFSIAGGDFAELTTEELEAIFRYDGCSEEQVKLRLDSFDRLQAEARQTQAELALTETAWETWTVEELSRCPEIADTARRSACEEKLRVEHQLSLLHLSQLPEEQVAEWRNHERRLERAAEIVEASTHFPTQATCERLRQVFEDTKGALEFIRDLGSPDDYLGIEAYLVSFVRISEELVRSCLSLVSTPTP